MPLLGELDHRQLPGRVASLLLYWAQSRRALRAQVMLRHRDRHRRRHPRHRTHCLPRAPGIAMMLLFNIGAAALLLPLRYGLGGAALAASAMLGEFVWTALRDNAGSRARWPNG